MDKKDLFPIGIGTWGIGGFTEKNTENDTADINSLKHSLKSGMNFIEINKWYSEGHSVDLFSNALRESGVKRNGLFFHQAIYQKNNNTLSDAEKEFYLVTKKLGTDYMDSIEFTQSGIIKFGFDSTVNFLKNKLETGETRYVSVTNVDLSTLKRFKEIFGDKLFCNELNFNFEIRENEDWGIIKFGEENNILNVLYQPLRRNRTAKRNWPLLVELSEKYKKTQNQIIINWLVSRGFLPMIKSSNIAHINENISALDFEQSNEDINRLNRFRPPGWVAPKIVWDDSKANDKNVAIHKLSNVFDELYDNQE